MFLKVQFPFIDLRYIMKEDMYQLNVVRNLDLDVIAKDGFIRGCGPIIERKNPNQLTEPVCCYSYKALSFRPTSIANQLLFQNDLDFLYYKRIFTHKLACKLELGMACKQHYYPRSFDDLQNLTDSVLNAEITVKDMFCEKKKAPKEPRKAKACKLKNIHTLFADYYLFSTIEKPGVNLPNLVNRNLIQFGHCNIICELFQCELDSKELPSDFRMKEIKEWDITIYYCERKRLWIIVKADKYAADLPGSNILRNFVSYLDRFIQQGECLDLLLQYINFNQHKISYHEVAMQSFLKHYLKNFLDKSYYGIENRFIIDILFDLKNVASPNFKDQLLQKSVGTDVYDMIIELVENANQKQLFYLEHSVTQLLQTVTQELLRSEAQNYDILKSLLLELENIQQEVHQGNIDASKKINIFDVISVSLSGFPIIKDLISKLLTLIERFYLI